MDLELTSSAPWPILNRFGTLSHLSATARASLVAAGRITRLETGEVAQRQGDSSAGLSCVLRGQLRFSSVDAAGTEFIFYIGFPGAWFGQTMFDTSPAVFTATAMTPTEIFQIPASRVLKLIEAEPAVALFVIRSLTRVGRIAIGRLKDQLTLPSDAIVACLLHKLAEDQPGHRMDELHLSQSDIAKMCGLSLRTVGRVLQRLRRKGAVTIAYTSLQVLDLGTLRETAAPAMSDFGFPELAPPFADRRH